MTSKRRKLLPDYIENYQKKVKFTVFIHYQYLHGSKLADVAALTGYDEADILAAVPESPEQIREIYKALAKGAIYEQCQLGNAAAMRIVATSQLGWIEPPEDEEDQPEPFTLQLAPRERSSRKRSAAGSKVERKKLN